MNWASFDRLPLPVCTMLGPSVDSQLWEARKRERERKGGRKREVERGRGWKKVGEGRRRKGVEEGEREGRTGGRERGRERKESMNEGGIVGRERWCPSEGRKEYVTPPYDDDTQSITYGKIEPVGSNNFWAVASSAQ